MQASPGGRMCQCEGHSMSSEARRGDDEALTRGAATFHSRVCFLICDLAQTPSLSSRD